MNTSIKQSNNRERIFILLLVVLLGMTGSLYGQQIRISGEPHRISAPNNHANAPYLTTDNKGRPVISWVEGTEEPLMFYAVLNEDGSIFKKPRSIPPSTGLAPHNEMMPKMIFKPDGEIIAVWPVKNRTPDSKYGGLIFYAQSFDNGKTWSDPIPITEDPDSYDQRYFDVAVLPDGRAAIIWLDNRSETEANGSTLYYAATNGENGFENEKVIGRSTCQCCRTNIYIDHRGYINVAYRNIFDGKFRDMAYAVSDDLGKSFSKPKRISYDNWAISACPHTGPTMAEIGGKLYFHWYTMGGGEGVYYTFTTNSGQHFAERKLFSKQARHPQAAATFGGTIAVVWDELTKTDNTFNNRIGLQLKEQGGNETFKKYLTSSQVHSTYPVVLGINDDKLLVAWVQESDHKQIYYRLISKRK